VSESYEYKPPHGSPPSKRYSPSSNKPDWDVTIPLGSELIQRRVSAEDKTKAFKRVVMELSRGLNKQPATLFRQIYADKKYTVKPATATNMNPTPSSTFIARAQSVVAYTPSIAGDLERIDRLPLVESVRVYSKNGNEVVYRATMPVGVKMHQVRELTGHIQNLFGARLLSSGPSQEKDDAGKTREIVEVRTSLLSLV
jgi:hypothetical protein